MIEIYRYHAKLNISMPPFIILLLWQAHTGNRFLMATLLIDNKDSFTYNIFQMVAEVNGEEPTVVGNDADPGVIDEATYDNIIISPGPGTPERREDFGICLHAIRHGRKPTLGVCLGHQGLAYAYGARVVPAPEVMHGRISQIQHEDDPLFKGVSSPFEAVRYHSLTVSDLPACLIPISWAEDGVLMALRHRELPQWGVQFHPESICTQFGYRIFENFKQLAADAS